MIPENPQKLINVFEKNEFLWMYTVLSHDSYYYIIIDLVSFIQSLLLVEPRVASVKKYCYLNEKRK